MSRAVVLVLDSLGIGGAPDAEAFGDAGANTLGHIAQACARGVRGDQGVLHLPNLAKLGLFLACEAASGVGVERKEWHCKIEGAFSYCSEQSTGKDTPSGHWEMAGLPVQFDWGYFPQPTQSFPQAFLDELAERAQLPGFLGNCHASGTQIIEDLGLEHIRSGKPIIYTSADSVIQIACHETHFGLDRLFALCQVARELADAYRVGRIIARPFMGETPDQFARTGNRRDYAVPPHGDTLLDHCLKAGREVIAIGKIKDIFSGRGISRYVPAHGNDAIFEATLTAFAQAPHGSLVISNFVDFDMLYGHRRDIVGYADALEAFDARLPELFAQLHENDLLVITADHGCDPSWPGSDHTRECVPFLMYGKKIKAGGFRSSKTFADIGQTLAAHLQVAPLAFGQSVFAE